MALGKDAFAIMVDGVNIIFDEGRLDHALFFVLGKSLTEIQVFETQIAFFWLA